MDSKLLTPLRARIIVGVKYCFRYNARSRQLRLNEDGEPINMETIQRPHRRRREKKLMTMDEVNEKFPMLKYKTWVASRAQEGLPTSGGISAPASPAASLVDAEGVIPETKEKHNTEDQHTSGAQHVTELRTDGQTDAVATQSPPLAVGQHPALPKPYSQHSQDEEEDEHIDAALPPELMGTSGDTCAICIDSLEDDDDVRGLTCGHAFHAVCLDPWLTSRRACCPLCKADYYTPKPRPPPTEQIDGLPVVTVTLDGHSRGGRGINMPTRPSAMRLNLRSTTRRMLPSHFTTDRSGDARSLANGRNGFFSRFRIQPANANLATASSARTPRPQQQGGGGVLSNLTSSFSFRPSRRTDARQMTTTASGPMPGLTDSQLEAGVRTS